MSIKQISVEREDHTYVSEPIGVDAENVEIGNRTLAEKAVAWDKAQANKIETVSVNGIPQTITDKNVDITTAVKTETITSEDIARLWGSKYEVLTPGDIDRLWDEESTDGDEGNTNS